MNNVRPSMSMGQSILAVLKNCLNFKGRARRSEFWWFAVFYGFLTFAVLINVYAYICTSNPEFFDENMGLKLAMVLGIPCLVLFILVAAVTVRRLHDTGKSAVLLLPGLIPVLGTLFIAYLLSEDSDIEANKFGESPKYYTSNGEAITKKAGSSFVGVIATLLMFVGGIFLALNTLGINLFENENEEVEMSEIEGLDPMEISEDDCIQVVDEEPVSVMDEAAAVETPEVTEEEAK